jgi:hypothetical protein
VESCGQLFLLTDCQGGKNDPVRIISEGDSRIVASWNDDGVPRRVGYDAGETSDDFPALPERIVENPARLVTALRDAAETASREAVRYATNCVQLKGAAGTINATDGRQLLTQTGFEFPWDDDVLVGRNTVFGSRELLDSECVAIGRTADWICLRTGLWTTWLEIVKDARFPNVTEHIPIPDDAKTVVMVADQDAEFLVKSLKKFPCNDDVNRPVTLDLNGSVAVRAQADGHPPTELTLSNSTIAGQTTRLNTNRVYLTHAAKLGFRHVRFYGPESPALCGDQYRSYVWALLGKDQAIKPSDKAIRVASPRNTSRATKNTTTRTKEKPSTMSTNRIPQSPSAEANGSHKQNGAAETASIDVLIEQGEAVKISLRESH